MDIDRSFLFVSDGKTDWMAKSAGFEATALILYLKEGMPLQGVMAVLGASATRGRWIP